jgi:hypothetical protein
VAGLFFFKNGIICGGGLWPSKDAEGGEKIKSISTRRRSYAYCSTSNKNGMANSVVCGSSQLDDDKIVVIILVTGHTFPTLRDLLPFVITRPGAASLIGLEPGLS